MKNKRTHIFMPPTSKTLRGHIGLGLCVCPLRLAYGQERLEIGSCLICRISMKKKRTRIFCRTFHCRVMYLFNIIFYFAIISPWKSVNTIPEEPLGL